MPTGLPMYTIYESPLDFPGKFVVRRHLVDADGSRPDAEPLCVADSLDSARALLLANVPGLACLGRHVEDEPQIVETWV